MLSQPMLTVHEVADFLKVKDGTVRSWIKQRTLRAIRLGRDWRVAPRDLELFIEACANTGKKVETVVGVDSRADKTTV